jgi:hypothetical protein
MMPGMPQLPLIDLADEGITVKVDHDFRASASPAEANFGDQQPAAATRRFFVTPWAKRDVFIRWLLGEVDVWADATPGPQLTRTPPQRHPLYPGMVAVRVPSVKGYLPAPGDRSAGDAGVRTFTLTDFDQDGNAVEQDYRLAEYESAVVEAEYQQVRYNAWGDGEFLAEIESGDGPTSPLAEFWRYTEVTDPKAAAEHLQAPGMTLVYTRKDGGTGGGGGSPQQPQGVAIPYATGLLLPLEEFTLIWRRVPYRLMDPLASPLPPLYRRIYGDPDAQDDYAKRPYLGTINKAAFFGRAAGTLLFSQFEMRRRSGPVPTTYEWDLHYTFTFDPNRGWDRKYFFPNNKSAAGAGWYYVSRSGTYAEHGSIPDKDSQYDERAFEALFRVGD